MDSYLIMGCAAQIAWYCTWRVWYKSSHFSNKNSCVKVNKIKKIKAKKKIYIYIKLNSRLFNLQMSACVAPEQRFCHHSNGSQEEASCTLKAREKQNKGEKNEARAFSVFFLQQCCFGNVFRLLIWTQAPRHILISVICHTAFQRQLNDVCQDIIIQCKLQWQDGLHTAADRDDGSLC